MRSGLTGAGRTWSGAATEEETGMDEELMALLTAVRGHLQGANGKLVSALFSAGDAAERNPAFDFRPGARRLMDDLKALEVEVKAATPRSRVEP